MYFCAYIYMQFYTHAYYFLSIDMCLESFFNVLNSKFLREPGFKIVLFAHLSQQQYM